MGEIKGIKNKNCVLLGCNNKAVGICNNCRIPICSVHSKRIGNEAYLCINCLEYMKKLRLRK